MGTPVIIDAVRTPLGKRKGWLAGVHPAVLHRARDERGAAPASGLDSELVDQVVGRLRHPGRRAVQRHGPPRLAARRARPAHRRHHGRRPVRLGPAGGAPGQRHDRRRHDRHRHRRGVEAMSRIPLGANVPARHRRPAARRLVDRHAQPVRGGRPDRQATAASPAPTSTRSASPRSRRRASPSTRAGSSARSPPITAPVLDAEGNADRRDPRRRHRPGPARHHPRGARRPARPCCPTACTPPAPRRRSATAPPPY